LAAAAGGHAQVGIMSRTDKGVSAWANYALASIPGAPRDEAAFRNWSDTIAIAANDWLRASAIQANIRAIQPLPEHLLKHGWTWKERGPVAAALAGPKLYEYFVVPDAIYDSEYDDDNRLLAWHIPDKLNVEDMQLAAAALAGLHNFRSFTDEHGLERNTVRNLLEVSVMKRPGLARRWRSASKVPIIKISFLGESFLYRMVRYMAFALVLVGRGKRPVSWIKDVLAREDRFINRDHAGGNVIETSSRIQGNSMQLRPAPAHGIRLSELIIVEDPDVEQIQKVLAAGPPVRAKKNKQSTPRTKTSSVISHTVCMITY
jgi:tRNA pseudouridine(38-40) synthase